MFQQLQTRDLLFFDYHSGVQQILQVLGSMRFDMVRVNLGCKITRPRLGDDPRLTAGKFCQCTVWMVFE